MRVLICGGRGYCNVPLIRKTLVELWGEGYKTLIHGAATGADTIAGIEGKLIGMDILAFPANWTKFGKSAGYIRNAQMLIEGKPELVVAFQGGRGTLNMLDQATKYGVATRRVGW